MSGPSRVLFQVGDNVIGTFRCRPVDPEFPHGWIDGPHLVFPRTAVVIIQEGEDPIATDPNVIVIYRGEGEYSRQALDPVGDMCEWFKIDPAWIHDALGEDESAIGMWAPPGRNHAIASPQVYLLQRWLTRFVATETTPDPLLVEEALLRIVHFVIGVAKEGRPAAPSSSDNLHREIVMSTRAFLGTHFTQPLTLAEIGRNVGASPYHLARLFRRHTGWSVHQYLTNLRLRAALGQLDESRATIADIAFEVGFADNSHLTKSFREKFGITPSQFRRGGSDLLSTILIA